jgi:hypothetical protein
VSVPKEIRKQADAAIVVKFADETVGKKEVVIKISDLEAEKTEE